MTKYIHFFLMFFIIKGAISCNSVESENKETMHHGHSHTDTKKSFNDNEDIKLINGFFQQTLFCTNGNVFAYTGESGDDIYIKFENQKKPKKILSLKGAGNNIGWSKDCSRIFYKEKNENYKIKIKSININTLKTTEHNEFDPGISLQSLSISDTIYNLDLISHDIYANIKGNDVVINKKKGNYYKFLLSPKNDYFILHEGSQIQLFSVDGNFIHSLGKGIATQWSSDGKSLIGFLDKSENGHSVTSSELYQFYIDKSVPKQLTFTPNIYEIWPSINKNKEIIYSDGLNGGIYKSKIQL